MPKKPATYQQAVEDMDEPEIEQRHRQKSDWEKYYYRQLKHPVR
jgi:hypothetical protein